MTNNLVMLMCFFLLFFQALASLDGAGTPLGCRITPHIGGTGPSSAYGGEEQR